MSTLRTAVEDYIALRRQLGFKLAHAHRYLREFIAFMEEREIPFITTEAALEWAMCPRRVHPSHWAQRLGAVRRFARHHCAADPRTQVPSPDLTPAVQRRVVEAAERIAAALRYVGVLCVEFFVLSDGSIVATEMAPRPHNSGHYSIDACITSQFEQQVRVLYVAMTRALRQLEMSHHGEGATVEQGRIIMFDGSNTQPLSPSCLPVGQSNEVQIADLVDNASERVTGLGLNANGTLGVARGDFAAYYFDRALRLEGSYYEDINPGGFGAALHPLHDEESGGSDDETLSFVGTAESTIKIIDTFHFFARGEIPIRDPIVGPLRATLPLPGFDNVALTCPGDPACVVVKLFGVTQSAGSVQPDGVVLIDVRERDID